MTKHDLAKTVAIPLVITLGALPVQASPLMTPSSSSSVTSRRPFPQASQAPCPKQVAAQAETANGQPTPIKRSTRTSGSLRLR